MNKLSILTYAAIFVVVVAMFVMLNLGAPPEYAQYVMWGGYLGMIILFSSIGFVKEWLEKRVKEYEAPRQTGLYIPAPDLRPKPQAAELPEQQAQPTTTDEEDGDVPT